MSAWQPSGPPRPETGPGAFCEETGKPWASMSVRSQLGSKGSPLTLEQTKGLTLQLKEAGV